MSAVHRLGCLCGPLAAQKWHLSGRKTHPVAWGSRDSNAADFLDKRAEPETWAPAESWASCP